MKIGWDVSELWSVENLPLPLTWPMAYTAACTTVQAVMLSQKACLWTMGSVYCRLGFSRVFCCRNLRPFHSFPQNHHSWSCVVLLFFKFLIALGSVDPVG